MYSWPLALFNCKRSLCIKYGFKGKGSEIVKLSWVKFEMVKSVRHLSNYFGGTFNGQTDCNIKKVNV